MLGTANEHGLVCDISSVGIYDAMKKMLSSKELRKHYAEQACARRSMFEPSSTVGAVEELIEQVLAK